MRLALSFSLALGLGLLGGCAIEEGSAGSQGLDPTGRWSLTSTSTGNCPQAEVQKVLGGGRTMSLEVGREGSVYMLRSGVADGAGMVLCTARRCDLGFDLDVSSQLDGSPATGTLALAVSMDAAGNISGDGTVTLSGAGQCTSTVSFSGAFVE
jgi:hypothetical protein